MVWSVSPSISNMVRKPLCGVTVAIVVLLLTTKTAADPAPNNLRLTGPREICKVEPERVCLTVGPGRYLDEPTWTVLDTEVRRLQDRETRLDAENRSLRESTKGWSPGWRTLALTLGTGIAIGAFAFR